MPVCLSVCLCICLTVRLCVYLFSCLFECHYFMLMYLKALQIYAVPNCFFVDIAKDTYIDKNNKLSS